MKSFYLFRYSYLCFALLLIGNLIFAQSTAKTDDIEANNDSNGNINNSNEPKEKTYVISNATLGIKPIENIEGYQYLFTSYILSNNNDLIVAVIDEEWNSQLKIINVENPIIVKTIDLPDLPVEMQSVGDKVYIFGRSMMMSIDSQYQLQTHEHSIRHYDLYNKMVTLNGDLFIYMGDGSAYKVEDLNLIPLEKIQYKNNDIWIQKTNPNAFELTIGSEKTLLQSKSNLGSMTILGEKNGNLYFVVENILQEEPFVLQRYIVSAQDQFSNKVIVGNMNDYSYIKNDLKFVDGKLYSLSADETNITITLKELAL